MKIGEVFGKIGNAAKKAADSSSKFIDKKLEEQRHHEKLVGYKKLILNQLSPQPSRKDEPS